MKSLKILLIVSTLATTGSALAIDVSTIFSNIGTENGDLSSWSLTQPNANHVATLSPPVNPVIDPADPANDPTTLTAPAGQFFVGLKRPGDTGPDLSYKMAHNATSISVASGSVFQVLVWANRGRLEPWDTPASTGTVSVRIFGWSAGSLPTVNSATDNWSRSITWNPAGQAFNFAPVADGSWGSQIFTFDPAAAGVNAANLAYLSISITAQNHNHDQYIATDIGVVPEPTTMACVAMALAVLALRKRR